MRRLAIAGALLLGGCLPTGYGYGSWNLSDPMDAFKPRPLGSCPYPYTIAQCQQVVDEHEAELRRRSVEEAKQREALAQTEKEEQSRGYKRISFEDLQLDASDLAASRSRVAVSGAYSILGTAEVLFSSDTAAYLARENPSPNMLVGLLTDEAPRDVRKRLLECQRQIANGIPGCDVTLLGHMTECSRTTIIGKTSIPCLDVEDMRR